MNQRFLADLPESLLCTNPAWCLKRLTEEEPPASDPLGRIRAAQRLPRILECLRAQQVAIPDAIIRSCQERLGLASIPSPLEPGPGVVGLLVDGGNVECRWSALWLCDSAERRTLPFLAGSRTLAFVKLMQQRMRRKSICPQTLSPEHD